ncbi:dipeptidase [Corynebacterium alimapuense]|uniref:Dipeptidase n=1 Tax=Corynebacterium alimapuense TaxID=1576874 RepID=A0A3M8KBY9_9CORY|nr:dipeptidase [Corynebacterium alimapuense]RNE49898.1 dipeptidase [Corynebacterium alimapuense]
MINSTPIDALRTHIESQREQIFADLSALVAFDSVHAKPGREEEYAAAAEWVRQSLIEAKLDVSTYLTSDGSTAVIGRKEAAEGMPTVLLYSHFDIVPAGEATKWTNDPFTLTEREGRWYGRGAADCKGNVAMHLAALRAVADAGGTDLGLVVLVEGSEEQGGEGLDQLLKDQPELFRADAILIADSGNAAVGKPTLTTSLRGGAQLVVTVDTLQAPVHSGQFGGAAPDAVAALVRLLDSLRDEHGRTSIDGVDASARWEGEPYTAEDFRADAGLLEGLSIMGAEDDHPSDLVWARPAISITGFSSTPVEKAVNAVPATAQAKLNLRVAPGYDADDVIEKLIAHLNAHTPWGAHVDIEVLDKNQPFSTDVTGPALTLLRENLAAAFGATHAAETGSGGSIPLTLALQESFPTAEIALYGVEEPKCTIHSPDESVDPNEIIGIGTAEAAFLLAYGLN